MISLQFVKAPDVGSGPTKVRIVHLSDTHMQHRRFDKNSIVGMDAFVLKEKTTVSNIKSAGDILIHTGDFTKRLKASADYDTVLKDFNNFLGELPHTHKIVIAGNSEIVFNSLTHEQIQNYLSNCTYLQDSSATIMGIKFYGTFTQVSKAQNCIKTILQAALGQRHAIWVLVVRVTKLRNTGKKYQRK